MKTFLALLMVLSFAFNAQAETGEEAVLKEKIEWALDQADKMDGSMVRSRISTTVFALESLANSNITDQDLIMRVLASVDTLSSNFNRRQQALTKRSLDKLNQR